MKDAWEAQFHDNIIRLELDLRCYSLGAVKKAGYSLAERFTLVLGSMDCAALAAELRFRVGASEQYAQESLRLFFQELLDQDLREAIADETSPLRALILAQAFSKTNLVQS